MSESARFEIYPDWMFKWRFRSSDGKITVQSAAFFFNRQAANEAIHDFMRAIDNSDCGIHPDIVDVDEWGEVVK